MALLPVWTKEIKLTERATDPLGLSRVSEYIVNELLPGLTTLTNRGRNFSFYTWALKVVNNTPIFTRKDFYEKMARLESAYVLAGYLHNELNTPEAKGPIGDVKARNRINNTQGRFINLNFSVLNLPGGGYQQYFRTAMSQLGLIIPLQKSDILSERGKKIADIFEQNVKDTEYFKKYLLKEDVDKDILQKFGSKCGYSCLKEFENERKALVDLFFDNNQNDSEITNSRKMTFSLILDLFDKFTDLNSQMKEDKEFRNVTFYKQFQCNKTVVGYNEDYFSEIIKLWRYYGFQEYFTIVLENILSVFIEYTKKTEKGVTKKEFIERYSSIVEILSKKVGKDLKGLTIHQIMDVIQDKVGVMKELNIENSNKFDIACSLGHQLSEEYLTIELSDAYEKHKFDEVLADSLLLLIVLIIRYYQYVNTYDEKTMWAYNREISEWSILSLFQDINKRLSSFTIQDFFEYIIEKIIEQHNLIAFDKLLYGNDSFRFQEQGNLFIFKREYRHQYRSNRFDSIRNIFEDIGLINNTKGKYCTTSLGKEVLKRIKNG